PRLAAFAHSHSPRAAAARHERSILAWKDLLDRMEDTIDPRSVVLSDPATGYSIPACTSHYTVCVLHQHGNPSDSLTIQRLAASRDVLSPYLGSADKARICERFRVEYVLVNQTFRRQLDLYTTRVGPEIAAKQRAALDADSLLFERVWVVESRGALYRVRRGHRVADSPPAIPVELEARLPEHVPAMEADARAGIDLVGVDIATPRVARGGVVDLVLYWRREGAAPTLPVRAHLRFDTPAPRGVPASLGLTKLDRLLRQRRNGTVYRLRRIHAPFDGQYGIERWPTDSILVDNVHVFIPRNAALGVYTLKATWFEEPLVPNLSLTDLLKDADLYDGVAVGVVDVVDVDEADEAEGTEGAEGAKETDAPGP
ncbi:MAG: hypothetical protein V1774_01525, partial [Candidatus Eisenbacteria bacterium]